MSESKLHVRLGAAEFEAEGSEFQVREQFAMFVTLVQSGVIPVAGIPASNSEPIDGVEESEPEAPGSENKRQETNAEALARRVFTEKDGVVSLLALPNGESEQADTILLCLYGFQKILAHDTVTTVALAKAVKQSGIALDRLDRVIAPFIGKFITRSGSRRGTRYGLTNRGVARAEEVMQATVE